MVSMSDKETGAWVLHPDIRTDKSRRSAHDALTEAIALANALPGLKVMGNMIVRLPRVHPGKLFGKGKIAELFEVFKDYQRKTYRCPWHQRDGNVGLYFSDVPLCL